MATHSFQKLSVLLPVFNEAESLKVMVQILKATMDFSHEILIIYDFPEDNSIPVGIWLQDRYPMIRLIHNQLGRGVPNAIKTGIKEAQGDVILIALVDEVFPIAKIEDMLKLIEGGCDFVSATRYALGGKRIGGSLIGHGLSLTANALFRLFSGSCLSDMTTGMKMIRKKCFEEINIEATAAGWAFAFEMAIKAHVHKLRMGEVPVVSVDRIFGGESSFRLGAWVKEYFRWFLWGIMRLKGKKIPQEIFILPKYKNLANKKCYRVVG